jgi:hypothetical protein
MTSLQFAWYFFLLSSFSFSILLLVQARYQLEGIDRWIHVVIAVFGLPVVYLYSSNFVDLFLF